MPRVPLPSACVLVRFRFMPDLGVDPTEPSTISPVLATWLLKQDLVVLRDALAALPFHYLDAFHLAAE